MEEIEIVSRLERYENYDHLPDEDRELVLKAYEYGKHAHAPYSNFKVGCAVLLENGEIVGGSNQENASFPAGICAERTALSACVSNFPNTAPIKVAIVVNEESFQLEMPTAPCGICRQSFQEVESIYNHPIEIIFPGENGRFYKAKSIQSLLPLSFEAKNLSKSK